MMTECPIQQEFFDKKILVKQDNGLIRMRDGGLVPRSFEGDPKTRAQKIAKLAKEKGWDNADKKNTMFSSVEENEKAYDEQPLHSDSLAAFMGQMTAIMKSLEVKNKDLEQKYEASEATRKDELAVIQKSLEQLLSGN
jgi:DNA-binding NtrC family response regulator